jgi:hypothetical protein
MNFFMIPPLVCFEFFGGDSETAPLSVGTSAASACAGGIVGARTTVRQGAY